MSYLVPAGEYQCEYAVKKSRFIARVVPVSSRGEVNAAVARAREAHPDARHHCWAYLLGKPEDASGAGMSDDGEPPGTAGKPILNVLQHGRLGDVLVIVVRYFGGVKLGAGGLVRAYGTAAQQALESAPSTRRRTWWKREVRGDFAAEQGLRRFVESVHGELGELSYGEGIVVAVRVEAEQLAALADYCAARGLVIIDPGDSGQ